MTVQPTLQPTLIEETTASTAMPADVHRFSNLIVNTYFVGTPGTAVGWTLIDAGLPFSAGAIQSAAEARFGTGAKPNAIVLTHGHFDHVGSLLALARQWDVPIWAHRLEAPYLTGRSAYPPPDPTVGGGSMSLMSPLYPKGPIDISRWLKILPDDGTIPPMPDWRWVHTPGHTAGHVSLFRESDRSLIVGDAFVTTRQESFFAALLKPHEIHGPPMYFTSDWAAARQSILELATLSPAWAFPGHGTPVSDAQLTLDLKTLTEQFDRVAKPAEGRYVDTPAMTNEDGVVSVPSAKMSLKTLGLYALVVAVIVGLLLTLTYTKRKGHDE